MIPAGVRSPNSKRGCSHAVSNRFRPRQSDAASSRRPGARIDGPRLGVGATTYGIPHRQTPARHRTAFQPIDRLRHRARLSSRGRGAGVQLCRRALQGAHHRVRGRIRRPWYSTATSATTRRSTRCSRNSPTHWARFDGLVHSIGFAPREAIAGDFLDGLTREKFRIAHDISAYSFPALAKAALPRLKAAHGAPDADLPRRRRGRCRTTTRWASRRRRSRPACATSRRASARRASASTASRPARSRRWPRAGIKGFGKILDVVERDRAAAAQRDDRRRRQRRGVPDVRSRRRRHGGNHLRRWRLQPRDGRRRGRSLGAARPLSESRWRRLPRLGARLARVERRDLLDLLRGHRAHHVAHLRVASRCAARPRRRPSTARRGSPSACLRATARRASGRRRRGRRCTARCCAADRRRAPAPGSDSS